MAAVEVVVPNRLVPFELERTLFATEQKYHPLGKHLNGGELSVDLRSVSWVDIGAAAQLVLFIDGWADELAEVNVHFPSARHLATDKDDQDRSWRAKAMRFLRYIKFHTALQKVAERRPCVINLLIDDVPLSRGSSDGDEPETYLQVVPMHWVRLDDTAQRRTIANHLTAAMRRSGEGIDGPDAQALSNVVLHELIENVVEHSASGDAALVCGFAHSHSLDNQQKDYPFEEHPYIEATRAAGLPLLELIVGDSGRGIAKTLEESFRRGPGLREENLTRNGLALPEIFPAEHRPCHILDQSLFLWPIQ